MKLLCSICLFVAAAVAQQQSITFIDLSPKDSPFKLTGTGIWSDSTANYSVTGTNTSGKEIVAFVLSVGDFNTTEHDHFFQSHGFEPGATDKVASLSDFPLPLAVIKKDIPLTLRFVQFADGSTWGNNQAAIKLMLRREELGDWLVARITAYDHSGENELLSQLSHESNPSVVGWARQALDVQHQSGTSAMIDYLQKKLDSANAWRRKGTF